MRSLSNSPAHRDAPGARHPSTVYRPVGPDEIDDALRLILATDGKVASDEQVLDFLSFAVHRGIDLNQTAIADQAGRMMWADVTRDSVMATGSAEVASVPWT